MQGIRLLLPTPYSLLCRRFVAARRLPETHFRDREALGSCEIENQFGDILGRRIHIKHVDAFALLPQQRQAGSSRCSSIGGQSHRYPPHGREGKVYLGNDECEDFYTGIDKALCDHSKYRRIMVTMFDDNGYDSDIPKKRETTNSQKGPAHAPTVHAIVAIADPFSLLNISIRGVGHP